MDLCRLMLASKLPFAHHLLIQQSPFLSLMPEHLFTVHHTNMFSFPQVAGINQELWVMQALPQLPPRDGV